MAKRKGPYRAGRAKQKPAKTTSTTTSVNVTSDQFISLGATKLTAVETQLVEAAQHLIKANELLAKVLHGKQPPKQTSWYVLQEPTP